MSTFYVYTFIHPITLVPFYVGKGKNKRAQVHFNNSNKGQNKLKDFHIKSIMEAGHEVTIHYEACISEQHAYLLECTLIKKYGRIDIKTGSLTNMQEGGEGAGAQRTLSLETKQRIATATKGKLTSQKTKNLIAESLSKRGNCSAVIQYTLDGVEMARYPSARSASIATGIDGSYILYCCRGKYSHTKNCTWSYADPNQTSVKQSKLIKKKVAKCDNGWNIIHIYESVSEAARDVGTSISNISRASNNNDFALGFFWKKTN